ncbi:MAG TPA: hypothetical protein VMT27_07675 [Actinomycetes bacterium]|nr:hypothetical protein [Actinomycetes bacterium]
MSESILNLKDAPDDPIERLIWLGGVKEQVEAEMDRHWTEAYFWSRFTGRLDTALGLGLHGRKRVMAYTRAGNESRGRTVKWGDGLT